MLNRQAQLPGQGSGVNLPVREYYVDNGPSLHSLLIHPLHYGLACLFIKIHFVLGSEKSTSSPQTTLPIGSAAAGTPAVHYRLSGEA